MIVRWTSESVISRRKTLSWILLSYKGGVLCLVRGLSFRQNRLKLFESTVNPLIKFRVAGSFLHFVDYRLGVGCIQPLLTPLR